MDLHTEAGWGERSVVSGNIPAGKMAGAEFFPTPVLQFKPLSLPLPSPSSPLLPSCSPERAGVQVWLL